ncbi:MAG: SPOR domain-containing protein [Gammaproteobacteria bacterium]|nr:SPOR domain-containing protein [Gammaproteobacteria bacterium]
MARTASSVGPGFELKHRIAGAVILITFAVVVLPMILGGPKPSGSSAPSAAAGDPADRQGDTQIFVSKITPIGGATPAPPAAPASSEPVPAANVSSKERASSPPAQAPAEKKTEPVPEPAPVASKAPSKPAAPAPATEKRAESAELDRGWVVRVGTYSQSENAKRVMDGLEKLGFEASSGSVQTRNGAATRVWVGPFAQRVEAARARTRIERAIGQKGLIAAFP